MAARKSPKTASRKAVRKPAKRTAKRASPKRSPRRAPAKPATTRRAPAARAAALPEGDELPVVVARSLVSQGRVQLRVEAPKRIELPLGRLLLVRHAYQLEESSSDKETYLFQLDASLGEHQKSPVVERITDRMGITEDLQGFIQQRFRPDQAGTYRLDFAASTEYEVRPWGSRQVQQKERREGAGRVTVVVA
jgi:hypothetical protein